jgi:hypothetical protein
MAVQRQFSSTYVIRHEVKLQQRATAFERDVSGVVWKVLKGMFCLIAVTRFRRFVALENGIIFSKGLCPSFKNRRC